MNMAFKIEHPLASIPASFEKRERWFVFFTHPSAEKRAQESISDLGLPVFVPFEKRIQRRLGRKPRRYEAALFPGYGFVRFDMNDERWGAIKHSDGVVDLLGSGGVPASVPDYAVEGLQLADTVGLFDRTKPPSVGMPVEITEGPFASFIGKVMKARSGDRIDVLLNIFGGDRSVTIPVSYMRALEA